MQDAYQFISEQKLLIKRLLLSVRCSFKIAICRKKENHENYVKYKIGTCIGHFM